MSGRKLARRACDACKIRKTKCTELPPCSACINAGIECTFNKKSQVRGPRKLRDATLQEIRRAQESLARQASSNQQNAPSTKYDGTDDPDPPPPPSSKISSLVEHLCLYRVKLYRMWPIIKVERIIASLQSPTPDIEVFALAYAVAAATIARTRLQERPTAPDNEANLLEAECLAAKAQVPSGRRPNVTTIRIAFFLHCLHETVDSGSMKSMLYLREAITIAQMISLHKEAYYSEVPVVEQQIRRRVLWMLYVTERVMCVQYHQPITLRTKIALPSVHDSDGPEVLLAFLRLVELFVTVDNTGIFDYLDDVESENVTSQMLASFAPSAEPVPSSPKPSRSSHLNSDLDLIVSRCWLLLVLQVVRMERFQHTPTMEDLNNAQQSVCLLMTRLQAISQETKDLNQPALGSKCAQTAAYLALLLKSATAADEGCAQTLSQFTTLCLQMDDSHTFTNRLQKELKIRPHVATWLQSGQARGLQTEPCPPDGFAQSQSINRVASNTNESSVSQMTNPQQQQVLWPELMDMYAFDTNSDHINIDFDQSQQEWFFQDMYGTPDSTGLEGSEHGTVVAGMAHHSGSLSPEFVGMSQAVAGMASPLHYYESV